MTASSLKHHRADSQKESVAGAEMMNSATPNEVRQQLQRMLASDIFVRSERLSRFLEFIVGRALEGSGNKLNQYVIALEVFDKSADFDPNIDPIVRVEAGRLRTKLREYYATVGQSDPLRINLRKVGYCPHFSRSSVSLRSPSQTVIEPSPQEMKAKPAPASPSVTLPLSRNLPVSIAVLPFAKLSPDDTSHRLCEELYRRVLHELVLTEGFLVRAGQRQPSPSIQNIQEIGEKLSTDLFLEGSLQRANGQIRIYAMLARTSDGCGIWADSYNHNLASPFSSEHEIARAIVDSVVRIVLPPGESTSPTI